MKFFNQLLRFCFVLVSVVFSAIWAIVKVILGMGVND